MSEIGSVSTTTTTTTTSDDACAPLTASNDDLMTPPNANERSEESSAARVSDDDDNDHEHDDDDDHVELSHEMSKNSMLEFNDPLSSGDVLLLTATDEDQHQQQQQLFNISGQHNVHGGLELVTQIGDETATFDDANGDDERTAEPEHEMTPEHVLKGEIKYLFKNTRYFLIKSNNFENVNLAKQKSVWSTPRVNEIKLNKAYKVCLYIFYIH